ncbi:hypothetical protein CJ030_MR2G014089 [Morella rubra]|uniref:Uncharacterized protein n=1 Tax=Morella rubra TaxID=262757 RepID=A0A6A1WEQ0_9ROSI|nr:hypothetical protein CJ030_MR2G014089 [Morella rubra]
MFILSVLSLMLLPPIRKVIRRCFCCISTEEQQEIRKVISTSCFCCIPNGEQLEARDYPWEIYSLKELLHATNNFHQDNKIGEGGFGSVYWVEQVKALRQ